MTIDSLRDHCLLKPGVREDTPFGDDVLALRVVDKIFALVNLVDVPLHVNLKCDPERAVELRERYEAVQPGYHMNKKHWNTVICDGSIPDDELFEMLDHSYDQVARGLRKADRERLATG